MRARKKPDLRLDIPSYPHDYVQMPPETRRLILEANRTPNDIQFIDDDASPSNSNKPLSPETSNTNVPARSATPEIKITGPENMTLSGDDKNGKKDEVIKNKSDLEKDDESPVERRKVMKRESISLPDGLKDYEVEALRKILNVNNVSLI